MKDPLEIRLCPERPDCSSAWTQIMRHHRAGGLMSRVFFRDWQLEINAQFTECREQRHEFGRTTAVAAPLQYVLGGGRRMTPTAFGEELERHLKALTIPQPEESDNE